MTGGNPPPYLLFQPKKYIFFLKTTIYFMEAKQTFKRVISCCTFSFSVSLTYFSTKYIKLSVMCFVLILYFLHIMICVSNQCHQSNLILNIFSLTYHERRGEMLDTLYNCLHICMKNENIVSSLFSLQPVLVIFQKVLF